METQSLYSDRADLYDAIYHFKRYDEEAARIHELLGQYGVAEGSSLLDVACGTGSHLSYLKRWYDVAGIDVSDAMLDLARRKLPGISLVKADMGRFDVERPVDALLCLFSSIGYLLNRERLESAARCFAAALRPGGVLIVEPFVPPSDFVAGRLMMHTFDGEDLKCARTCVPGRDGERAILDFHWLVLRKGRTTVEHFVERHELWLCRHELLAEVLQHAGLSVRREARGLAPERDLLVAQRP